MASNETSVPAQPLTAEAFMATREKFWHGFTKFTVNAVIGVVALVILMWIFLV
jgi:hypothetical protein